AARRRQQFRRARGRHRRSAKYRRERAAIAGLIRGKECDRARRKPSAGADAAVHVGGTSAEVNMTLSPHLPSRREALTGSGALFAWSQLPRLARAAGDRKSVV